ncbi:MAG TPA: outer membrane porin, OprD family [Sulfurimonas sp.]|nr:outer membrane porin, OprD family [Sulfurimonas sp.]
MKNILLTSLLLAQSLFAADSIATWFEEGTVKGNIKYYFIETKKDKADSSNTSDHANAVGGTLNYTTGNLYGFSTGATLMTTNGFALPNSVDASILGKDNGIRLKDDNGSIAQDSFSVLGEVFVKYTYEDLTLLYGRKVITTPLIDSKLVRMLPSAVQGAFVDYKMDKVTLGASYLTHFKQRTSDEFTNIVKHALGDNTRLVTGSDKGEVIVADVVYKSDKTTFKLYDYYADDFMNSFYVDVDIKNTIDSGWTFNAGYQYIYQTSVGNADDYFSTAGSLTGGKKISSNAIGKLTIINI